MTEFVHPPLSHSGQLRISSRASDSAVIDRNPIPMPSALTIILLGKGSSSTEEFSTQ
jgi:hypothetical protein